MDIIFLRELRVDTLIGIYEWEKRVPQTLQLDLEIALPNGRAGQSDDIADALDYAKIIAPLSGRRTRASRRFPPAGARSTRRAHRANHA